MENFSCYDALLVAEMDVSPLSFLVVPIPFSTLPSPLPSHVRGYPSTYRRPGTHRTGCLILDNSTSRCRRQYQCQSTRPIYAPFFLVLPLSAITSSILRSRRFNITPASSLVFCRRCASLAVVAVWPSGVRNVITLQYPYALLIPTPESFLRDTA